MGIARAPDFGVGSECHDALLHLGPSPAQVGPGRLWFSRPDDPQTRGDVHFFGCHGISVVCERLQQSHGHGVSHGSVKWNEEDSSTGKKILYLYIIKFIVLQSFYFLNSGLLSHVI